MMDKDSPLNSRTQILARTYKKLLSSRLIRDMFLDFSNTT